MVQVALSKVQTADRTTNQLQDNVGTALIKIQNNIPNANSVTIRGALTSPVQVLSTDFIVETTLTTASAVSVFLPSNPTQGNTYVVVDGTGDAATNNVTVSTQPNNGVPTTINGSDSYVISTNYGHAQFVFDGKNWVVI